MYVRIVYMTSPRLMYRTSPLLVGAQWPLAPYYCSFWPDRAVERYTGPWNKKLANPILVTGNTVSAPHYVAVKSALTRVVCARSPRGSTIL